MTHGEEGAVRWPCLMCSLSLFCALDPLPSSFLCQAGPALAPQNPPTQPPPSPLSTPSSWSCLFSQLCCSQSFLKDGCTGGFVCQLSTLTPTSSTSTASAFGHGGGS